MADNEIVLSCDFCKETVFLNDNFCSICGKRLNKEELLLKYYFRQGYEYPDEYEVILFFLSKFHGIEMSLRTLKSRYRSLGLRRRGADFDETEVRARMVGFVTYAQHERHVGSTKPHGLI